MKKAMPFAKSVKAVEKSADCEKEEKSEKGKRPFPFARKGGKLSANEAKAIAVGAAKKKKVK